MTARKAGDELSHAEHLVRSMGWRLAAWRAALIGAAAAAVILLLPWLPQPGIRSLGSPFPFLLLLLGLVGLGGTGFVTGLASRVSGRKRRFREMEEARGLRTGALSGALELGRGDGAVSDLAQLHRQAVAEALRGGSRHEMLPAASGRLQSARRIAIPGLGVALAVALAGLLDRPAEVVRTLDALSAPWSITFPPPPPPLRLTAPDGEILRGSSVSITVMAEGRGEIDLLQQRAGLALHRVTIPVAGGRAQAELGPIQEATRFWAEGRDGSVSDTIEIVPVDALTVTELHVEIAFPEYLGRPPESVRGPMSSLEVPVGTTLRLTATTNHPVARFDVVLERRQGRDTLSLVVEGDAARGSMVVSDSVLLSWRLEPADRVPGVRPPPPLSVSVAPDMPPTVTISYPGEDRVAGIEGDFPLVVEARDDHGLANVGLVWWREAPGRRGTARSQLLDDADAARRITLRPVLDLNLAGLLPGDELVYYATARDRRPGGQPSISETYRIRVTSVRGLQRTLARSTGALAEDARDLRDRAERLAESAQEAERRHGSLTAEPASQPEQDRLDSRAAQDARSVLAEARSLEEEAGQIRDSLSAVRESLESSPVHDPDLERRLGELEELYAEILESGLGERIEELQQALRDLRGEDVRGAMSNLSRQAAELEDRLDRALGLLERVAVEQALEGSRQQAEDLASRQARSASSRTQPPTFCRGPR